ncbi:MAG: hypothetical protein ABJB86_02705 [Bacteroidota bacterium]
MIFHQRKQLFAAVRFEMDIFVEQEVYSGQQDVGKMDKMKIDKFGNLIVFIFVQKSSWGKYIGNILMRVALYAFFLGLFSAFQCGYFFLQIDT